MKLRTATQEVEGYLRVNYRFATLLIVVVLVPVGWCSAIIGGGGWPCNGDREAGWLVVV